MVLGGLGWAFVLAVLGARGTEAPQQHICILPGFL